MRALRGSRAFISAQAAVARESADVSRARAGIAGARERESDTANGTMSRAAASKATKVLTCGGTQ